MENNPHTKLVCVVLGNELTAESAIAFMWSTNLLLFELIVTDWYAWQQILI